MKKCLKCKHINGNDICPHFNYVGEKALPLNFIEDIYKLKSNNNVKFIKFNFSEIEFNVNATLKQLYDLRKYIHQKYKVRCLVKILRTNKNKNLLKKLKIYYLPFPFDPSEQSLSIMSKDYKFDANFYITRKDEPLEIRKKDEFYDSFLFKPDPVYDKNSKENTDNVELI